MSIVDDAKPILDAARALLDDVGLREFRVFVRTRDWSGERVGLGTATEQLRELTVAGGKRPKVTALSPRAVVASGGQLGDTVFAVGPLTPAYAGGGVLPSDVTPGRSGRREVHYLVRGPGLPASGAVCKQLSADHSSPFRVTMQLQMTGEV